MPLNYIGAQGQLRSHGATKAEMSWLQVFKGQIVAVSEEIMVFKILA